MNGPTVLLALGSLAAIVVAYGPLLADFGEDLWRKPHYQHAPFVVLAAALLALQQMASRPTSTRPIRKPDSGRPWTAYAAFGISWLILLASYGIPSPLLAVISLICLVGGVGLSVTQRAGIAFPLGPWLLLWLVLPPPLELDKRMMTWLQQVSSRLSSYTLDLFGINHLMDGNALVLQEKQLFVDEACSGIISVVSIISCGAMYGVWRRRGGIHTVLMMALAAAWAMMLNVVRIVSIAVAWVRLGVDWSEGMAHTTLGLVIFGVSLLLLVASDWLLKALLAEIGPRWEQLTAEPISWGAPLVGLWDRMTNQQATKAGVPARSDRLWPHAASAFSLGLVPTLAFAGLGASQLLSSGDPKIGGMRVDLDAFAAALQREVMPETVGTMRLVDVQHDNRTASSQFGEHSIVYQYQDENSDRYLLSCDFAFHGGWHELAECYTGIGWRLEEHLVLPGEDARDGEYEFVRLELTKPDGRSAAVTYTACESGGGAIRPPRLELMDRLVQALDRKRRFARSRQSFQVQVLLERAEGVTDTDRKKAAELMSLARRQFLRTAKSLAVPAA